VLSRLRAYVVLACSRYPKKARNRHDIENQSHKHGNVSNLSDHARCSLLTHLRQRWSIPLVSARDQISCRCGRGATKLGWWPGASARADFTSRNLHRMSGCLGRGQPVFPNPWPRCATHSRRGFSLSSPGKEMHSFMVAFAALASARRPGEAREGNRVDHGRYCAMRFMNSRSACEKSYRGRSVSTFTTQSARRKGP
jgi:hypothetical protein